MKFGHLTLPALCLGLAVQVCAQSPPNGTQLFQNLQKLGTSFNVNNPAVVSLSGNEGPKGLAAADFDGDGRNDLAAANHDGTVAILFGSSTGGFEPVRYRAAGNPRGLRDVIAANVLGDPRPEIIAAHPFEGKLYIFSISGGAGSRTFGTPLVVTTWQGARGVTAGDFNGDGKMDLAIGGAGDGFREYRGDGLGGFTPMPPVAAISPGPPPMNGLEVSSAKPVFTMHAWRKTGETRDRLAVSFAGAGYIWFLGSTDTAPLSVTSALPLLKEESVYDLTMAGVSAESRASGEPDLITAVTWSGEVFIRQYMGPGGPAPYSTVPQVRLAVPGAPRAVIAADVNNDSWPDLLVASRAGNSISVYHNTSGTLRLASQTPAGDSPRDVVAADFDGNGRPDAAVINLHSKDITLHLIDPATGLFLQSPLVKAVVGGAQSLSITNLDGGPRSELLFLTRGTGEANIMKWGANAWMPAVRYQMGVRPETLTTPDINGDGLPDLMVASSGDWRTSGGVRYRYQLPDHTFGPLITAEAPGVHPFSAYAAISRDFNGDGRIDFIASSYFNPEMYFFEGTASGLVYRRAAFVASWIRSIVPADVDQDGDFDIIAAGYYGDIAVVENNGAWFTAEQPVLSHPYTGLPVSGVYAVKVLDRNGDGDPDLTVQGIESVSQWNGGSGAYFTNTGTTPLLPTLGAGESLFDYDGDTYPDTFVICPSQTTAAFFKGKSGANGQWWSSAYVPYAIPSSFELATGDLDSDGRLDLAGAGDYLWAAVSGSPAPPPVATPSPSSVPDIAGVTINEVLASADEFIAPGSNKAVDCVEIFNGTGAAVDLTNWVLRIAPKPGQEPKSDFIFPSATVPPNGIVVVFCTEKTEAWHAPFKLPAEGGTLLLLKPDSVESDSVTYPPQRTDISYARIFDGSRNFVFNPFPGIGSTNFDNGNVEPKLEFKGVDAALLQSGIWRFRADAWDDSGMQSMSIQWRIVSGGTGGTGGNSGIVPLYDDGRHDDHAALDGIYAGDLNVVIPPGTVVEFYLRGTDRQWQSSTLPEGPEFTAPGQTIQNYSLSLPESPLGWEISEVVSKNLTGFADETGAGFPDWAEIRYTGPIPAIVENLYLADSLFDLNPEKLYDVSRLGTSVTPGTAKVVILDGTIDSGANPNHGPFSLDNEGDSIFLIRRLPSGATELVDSVKIPPLPADRAWARMGVQGPFVETSPTPYAANAPAEGALFFVPNGAGTDVVVAFSGAGRIEASSSPGTWATALPPVPDTGFEHSLREPVQPRRFFRIR
ncbi:MAG TPA: FG-GAP-like repeat-containing protein [Verrucomicrobiales bacterium]|nr:FG-GAP-like repeat-containing protein [Verrucomicrobiales bacterium]